MTTIFECETELGKCDRQMLEDLETRSHLGDDCTIIAHTTAALNATRRLLKIEQRCYLRMGDDIPEQHWVKPEVSFEPAAEAEHDLTDMMRRVHEDFVTRAREQFPANCIL